MESVSVKRRPSVLIAAAKWWPFSARLASSLRSHGWTVSVLCPRGHTLAKVAKLERIHYYSGVDSVSSLSRALKETRPDIVVPCDDGVVSQLHTLHFRESALGSLIEDSLGHPEGFSVVGSRHRLLATAAELGIPTAESRPILGSDDLAQWHEQVAPASVIKVDGESGGNGVRICHSLEESLAAWRELSCPPGLATSCKRLLIDRDPIALWRYRNLSKPEISAQRIIHGRPANCMAACRNGELISVVSVEVLVADGPTGAAIVVRRIRDRHMESAAGLLSERLKISGFFGLDFMIDCKSGIPILIEMNPRATQLGHMEFVDQNSLVGSFSAAWRGEAAPEPKEPIQASAIALFPQALRSTTSRYRDSSYLDVPWDEPDVHTELKLDPWPQRRWAARLYHKIRPIVRSSAVEYETRDSSARGPLVSPLRNKNVSPQELLAGRLLP